MHALTIHDSIKVAGGSDQLLTAANLRVPHDAMARMHEEGFLERVIPGVYIGAAQPKHPLIDLAAWTVGHPKVVGSMLTAAVYHDLTDAFATGTWLFVPKGATVLRSRVVNVHTIQILPALVDPNANNENGITTLKVHGVDVRITNPDRTVVDLWRYSHHVSAEHALHALRRRYQSKDFRVPVFARLAQRLHAWKRIEPVLQGLALR